MAEVATIARPYAEALLKASAGGDAAALAAEVTALAQVAADASGFTSSRLSSQSSPGAASQAAEAKRS